MTYNTYIKKDYSIRAEWNIKGKATSRFMKWSCSGGAVFLMLGLIIFAVGFSSADQPSGEVVLEDIANRIANPEKEKRVGPTLVPPATIVPISYRSYVHQQTMDDKTVEQPGLWHSVSVKPGDSLARIFKQQGLSPTTLHKIMSLGKKVAVLKKIKPGQILRFHIEDNVLLGMEYEMSLTKVLRLLKKENTFSSVIAEEALERRVKHASAVIYDSLFIAGKKAGMTDNLIMQLVTVYGWDIDFTLDIRAGDKFTVIYEEQYKKGVKVSDGPIIAAEFVNRSTPLRAVRYVHKDGRDDYYSDNGDAMRKAFLRTPVEFARISSRFNLKRKHPILNRIRAHKGVDYAAATGTPIKATGDGTVIHVGNKGGYGRTIILKHGGKYSTLYAHLHRYAKSVRVGSRVKQGQVIGYVGKTGLATGSHLHYEFRVNGVHRNPLTVKLPKAEAISKKHLTVFKSKITPLLTELDRLKQKTGLAQTGESPTRLVNVMLTDG